MRLDGIIRGCCVAILGIALFNLVEATAQVAPDELIDLQLERAPLVATLQSFASISGSRLDIDPKIEGSVTLALEKTPWRQVLDRICSDHRLDCELLTGNPPILRVRLASDAEDGAAPVDNVAPDSRSQVLVTRPPAGAEDRLLNVRLAPPGASVPVEGTARFNWTTPIRAFSSAISTKPEKDADDPWWQVQLSWIPFGPALDLIVPIIVRCDAEGYDSELLPPIQWPPDETLTRQWQGALVELSNTTEDSGPAGDPAPRLDCDRGTISGNLRATFRHSDEGESAREAVLELESRSGTYLLVTPPGADDRPTPAAAVLALGPDAQERLRIVILRPVTSQAGFAIERRALSADGGIHESIATPDGQQFDLHLQLVR